MLKKIAAVAELADALASGASGRKIMGVRISPAALIILTIKIELIK